MNDMLAGFGPISLTEAEGVRLQNRKDTKYIIHEAELLAILPHIIKDYQVLEIHGHRMQRYESVYFDTPTHKTYLNHHNGHLNRVKYRLRHYLETGVSFFEVKCKDNHMRTVKARIAVPYGQPDLKAIDFTSLPQMAQDGLAGLTPKLEVSFDRIMLASLERNERITIDLNLCLKSTDSGKSVDLDNIAVVEVKRNRALGLAPIQKIMKAMGIRKSPMSKYCVGMALNVPELKQNRFKVLLRHIRQIQDSTQPLAASELIPSR